MVRSCEIAYGIMRPDNNCGGVKQGLKIVDLTGAGDLFAAGFLHGFVNKMSLKESLDKGTEMSSKVIQQIGARL